MQGVGRKIFVGLREAGRRGGEGWEWGLSKLSP